MRKKESSFDSARLLLHRVKQKCDDRPIVMLDLSWIEFFRTLARTNF